MINAKDISLNVNDANRSAPILRVIFTSDVDMLQCKNDLIKLETYKQKALQLQHIRGWLVSNLTKEQLDMLEVLTDELSRKTLKLLADVEEVKDVK